MGWIVYVLTCNWLLLEPVIISFRTEFLTPLRKRSELLVKSSEGTVWENDVFIRIIEHVWNLEYFEINPMKNCRCLMIQIVKNLDPEINLPFSPGKYSECIFQKFRTIANKVTKCEGKMLQIAYLESKCVLT